MKKQIQHSSQTNPVTQGYKVAPTGKVNQARSSNLIPLLLLTVSGLLVFLVAEQERQKSDLSLIQDQSSLSSDSIQKNNDLQTLQDQSNQIVNEHLFFTDQKIYWEQELKKLENFKSHYALDTEVGLDAIEDQSGSAGLDFEPEAQDRHLLNDLKRDRTRIEAYLGPRSKIQSQIVEDQALLQHRENMRRQYAQEFVRNARAGGYDVVLDEDLNVKSVRPLRTNEQRQPGSWLSQPYGAQ